jgi:hypothetical protein
VLLLVSCAPTSTSGPGSAARPTGGEQGTAAPKVLRIAVQVQSEPSTGIVDMTGIATAGSGALEHRLTFHAGLTVVDASSVLQPRAALQVPSLQDGTWQTFPDGRMELTWKLRPNGY